MEKEISEKAKRFLEVINKSGFKISAINKIESSITSQKVAHIKSGRNKPSDELINALLRVFPDVDDVWLKTGIHTNTINEPQNNYPEDSNALTKQDIKDIAELVVDNWDAIIKQEEIFEYKFKHEAVEWYRRIKKG
jgi:acetolactate synthase regulatory subunit